MQRAFLLFLMVSLVISSCSKDELDPIQACATDNVLQDLPWLAELIEGLEQSEIGSKYSYISQAVYEGQTVFVLQNCCPFCNSIYTVTDCAGNDLGFIGSGGIDPSTITSSEVIWKSSENTCAFEN
jgi:hypothetical protein